MWEALVCTTDSGTDRRGDVICVKPSPATWGELERATFAVVRLEDDTITETTYPYAITETLESPFGGSTTYMLNRSAYRVNLDDLKEINRKSDLIFDPSERA